MRKECIKMAKRSLAMILSAAMAVSLMGCGGSAKQDQKIMKDMVYQAQEIGTADQIQGDINCYAIAGEDIYLYTSEYVEGQGASHKAATLVEPALDERAEEEAVEEETAVESAEDVASEDVATDEVSDEEAIDEAVADNTTDEVVEDYSYTINQYLYKMKLDGSDCKMLNQTITDSENPESEFISAMSAGKDGDIYALYNSYDNTHGMNTFTIRILGTDGLEKFSFNMTDVMENKNAYIQTMCLDDEDNIYLLADQIIYVMAKDGAELFRVKTEDGGSGLVKVRDGNVVLCTYGDTGMELITIDKQTKGVGTTYKMKENFYGSGNLVSGLGEYDFFYNDNTNLCGYNLASETSTPVINWVSSNIGATNVFDIQALEDGSFICNYDDVTEGESGRSLHLLKKVDPSEVADKVIITYGGIFVNDQVKTHAVKFNKSQNQYQIVVKDYSNSEDAAKDMAADLLAGEVPDIMDLTNMNVDKYIAKGMLTDLYSFMENDADVKKTDFQENILKLMETDGKLYRISPNFGIYALIGSTKDIGSSDHFTMDDVKALEEKYNARAFHMASNANILSKVCSANYNSYIDWNTGKCSFDSDDFIKLLEYANTYPKDEELDWDNYKSLPAEIKNKHILFADVSGMSMEELEVYDKMFGEDITAKGYPSDGPTGPAVLLDVSVGIYSKSANKDGAWAFLKTMLTEEYVEGKGSYYYGGFPLRKDALEDEFAKYSATEKFTDKFGNEIIPIDSSWGYNDIEVKIDPLTDAQVDKVREVLAAADHLYVYDDEIGSIISEESESFFNGQKSAKEVAQIIQNRVSTYVNENR